MLHASLASLDLNSFKVSTAEKRRRPHSFGFRFHDQHHFAKSALSACALSSLLSLSLSLIKNKKCIFLVDDVQLLMLGSDALC